MDNKTADFTNVDISNLISMLVLSVCLLISLPARKMCCAQKDVAVQLNTNVAFKTIISMLEQEMKQNDPRRVQP